MSYNAMNNSNGQRSRGSIGVWFMPLTFLMHGTLLPLCPAEDWPGPIVRDREQAETLQAHTAPAKVASPRDTLPDTQPSWFAGAAPHSLAQQKELLLPYDAPASELRFLRHLPSLTYLRLSRHVSDSDCSQLVVCRQLETLEAGRSVKGKGLIYLQALPRLTHLHLAATDDVTLQYVVQVKQLKKLTLRLSGVSDAGLALLTELPQLEALTLVGRFHENRITQAGLEKAIRPLLHLKHLALYMDHIDYSFTASLDGLQDLIIPGSPVGDAFIERLSELRGLRHLDVSGTQITDKSMRYAARCKEMELLDVSRTSISDAGLSDLSPAVRLKRLYLYNTRMTDQGLRAVGRLRSLTHLALPKGIAGSGLVHLEHLDLTWLDLSGARVTDIDLNNLKQLSRLETLLLSDTDVTAAGIRSLRGMKSLLRVDARGTNIAYGDIVKLRQDLRFQILHDGPFGR